MKLSFLNLLYDHSLAPLRSQPKEIDGSGKGGYPGTDDILKKLEKLGVECVSAVPAIYKLNGLYFQFRYSGVDESSFGGVPRGFSENIDNNAPRLIVAIRKKPDADRYSVASVDPSKAKDSGSWGTSGASWSDPMTLADANNNIAALIAKIAGVVSK